MAQAVSISTPARTLRYSGSDRPAWRMNHTGVYGTGSRRQARMKTESASWGFTAPACHVRAPLSALTHDLGLQNDTSKARDRVW
ncbi:hypothetical protein GCM10010116_38470 [Microbispora rosea subsp. aerata]|nr:hypothetical protein GCM10010116_38470 [Microbispora rosea subsp. aerata]GIH54255.1 hypothetical protein Mro02_11690 [Microbispora rosea subsp. aerata]GLJ81566.1 hypothetical protein GCM10017588_02900 [Microbispora rosea subsp. aerata]